MELLDRFLKYVSFDTQSDPDSTTYPSTARQHLLLDYLHEELQRLGLEEVSKDEYGYVMATIPASVGAEDWPVIGFIAHVDTSPDMPGEGVRPQIIRNYDGGDIRLNDTLVLSPREYPDLRELRGGTVITTDGTTLLGADDKAGVAAIVTAAEYLVSHPELRHGKIRVGFTADEEIGRGTDYFDIARFGADWAYTLDGSKLGELEYENFNAAAANIIIKGVQFHPGAAKGRMVNALHVAQELNGMLPAEQRPEHTEGYEGFYHLTSLCGTVDRATMEYIVRDFVRANFEARKSKLDDAAAALNSRYGAGTATVVCTDQYYNMYDVVSRHPQVIERAKRAMERAGVTPVVVPVRGGTDGARLSERGLPCPNIFTGGANFHSLYEYCSLETMRKAVETIVNIATIE